MNAFDSKTSRCFKIKTIIMIQIMCICRGSLKCHMKLFHFCMWDFIEDLLNWLCEKVLQSSRYLEFHLSITITIIIKLCLQICSFYFYLTLTRLWATGLTLCSGITWVSAMLDKHPTSSIMAPAPVLLILCNNNYAFHG